MDAQINTSDVALLRRAWPQWTLTRRIGSGSYGVVYECRRSVGNLDMSDAVKIIRVPSGRQDVSDLIAGGMSEDDVRTYYRKLAQRLLDEVRVLEALKSAPYIMSIHDSELLPLDDGVGWAVLIRLELLTSLADWRRTHEMTVQDLIKMGMDICEALKNCARMKIIHRDIKPQNIFVSDFGQFKLGDFGVSRIMEESRTTATYRGTGNYMAPEIFRQEKYNHTVDIYALGLTLYRLLNDGFPPFSDPRFNSSGMDAHQRRLSGEPFPDPRFGNAELSAILRKACAFDPRNRYQSAQQMQTALKQWLDKERTGERKLLSTCLSMPARGTFFSGSLSSSTQRTGGRRPGSAVAFAGRESPLHMKAIAGNNPAGHTAVPRNFPKQSAPPLPPLVAKKPRRRSVAAVILPVLLLVLAGILLWTFKDRLFPGNTSARTDLTGSASFYRHMAEAEVYYRDLYISGDDNFIYRKADDDRLYIYKYQGNEETVTVPAELDGFTVIGIEERAFSGQPVRKVELPDTLSVIQAEAFSNCNNLTDINIPAGVRYIGRHAFYNTPWLNNRPQEFVIVGNGCLIRCNREATHLVIPDEVRFFGADLANTNIQSLTFGEKSELEEIGDLSFYGCTQLQLDALPDNLKRIGEKAFSGCNSLISIRLPSEIKHIGFKAFIPESGNQSGTLIRFAGSETDWNSVEGTEGLNAVFNAQ